MGYAKALFAHDLTTDFYMSIRRARAWVHIPAYVLRQGGAKLSRDIMRRMMQDGLRCLFYDRRRGAVCAALGTTVLAAAAEEAPSWAQGCRPARKRTKQREPLPDENTDSESANSESADNGAKSLAALAYLGIL